MISFYIIIPILLLLPVYFTRKSYVKYKALTENGIETTATIKRLYEKSSRAVVYRAVFNYDVDGKEFERDLAIHYALFSQLKVGDKHSVLYFKEEPSYADFPVNLAWYRTFRNSLILLIVYAGLIVLSLFLPYE